MSVLRLKVRGHIGIKEGLGLDEIDLDFSRLSGLVAFVGKNGSAKSTCLELLQPYATVVSRKGAFSKHFFLRDSFKELHFPFQGHQYRSLIKIDPVSNRSEGYLWKDGAEKSLSDGKISNYNKVITDLLGSSDLFFASTFCAQNAKKLNELTTGKLQELFGEILHLDKLVEYSETSRQCKNVLIGILEKIEVELKMLHEVASFYDEDVNKLTNTKSFQVELGQGLEEIKKLIVTAEDMLALERDRAKESEIARAHIDNLQSSLDQITASLHKDVAKKELELDAIRKEYQRLDMDIMESDSLLANEHEIRTAAEKVMIMRDNLEADKTTWLVLDKQHYAAEKQTYKKEAEAADALAKHKGLLNEGKSGVTMIEHKLIVAKRTLSDLKGIDPDCTSTICSFILRAKKAHKETPILTARLSDHKAAITLEEQACSAIQGDFKTDIDALGKIELSKKASKEQLGQDITALESKIAALKPMANDLSKVEVAKARKQSAEKQKAEVTQRGISTKKSWDKRIEEGSAQQSQAEKAQMEAQVAFKDIGKTDILDAIAVVKDLQEQKATVNDKIAETNTTISLIEDRLARKLKAREELKTKEAEKAILIKEISDWAYLQDACGKKGIQALEIDGMAPRISAIANNLLINTLSSAFTIQFKTLDDEGREILDIIVTKKDETKVLMDNLSGGQKVFLLKALRLSMALIVKEKHKNHYSLAFADEEDGALDVNNAVEFMRMYRAFAVTGGFDSFFFISHKIECQNLSDHIVRFGDGKIVID